MKILQLKDDIDDFIRDANELANVPNNKSILSMEAVVRSAFLATQAAVHRQTGSLAQSGRFTTELKDDEWIGTITYGGPSPGSIHSFVDYAEYERERPGHDFFEELIAYEALFEEAFNADFQ